MNTVKNKACFIVCWFGTLPDYFPVWLQTVKYNENFDFLIFTDDSNIYKFELPKNVFVKDLTLLDFKNKAELALHRKCSLNKPYRVCDFRPMFGLIFSKELISYEFWGYCDLDVVFGNIKKYVTPQVLSVYNAVFNGGHFTLIRNTLRMNNLFKKDGATFDYKKVIKHDAIFAFDEITGIQQIAHKQKIKALYLIPYVDADTSHVQLTSVLDKKNPENQAFYWEKGKLFRVKIDKGNIYFVELTYIHLQKRPIILKDSLSDLKISFWIEPDGFEKKKKLGLPMPEEIKSKNPFLGYKMMNVERKRYKRKKIKQLLKRNTFQIYVRIIQEKNGINKNKGSIENIKWKKY